MAAQVIKFKRGNAANLPVEANSGEPVVALDTGDLYVGQGTGFPLKKIGAGGTGVSLVRYEAGAGSGSYVLATGTGVTITKVANAATISAPAGVQILSASVHFTTTDIGSNTAASVDFGSNVGTGDNSTYALLFAPQFQVWADVAGSRAYKTVAAGNLNLGPHTLQVTGLAANQAIWVNLSF
jgi:hypothetical protein